MAAEFRVLFAGYVRTPQVASTVSFVRDGDVRVIIDPGMVPDTDSIMRPLQAIGVSPQAITDVILSHHHPDHTLNAALFPNARVHDYWAIYRGDHWDSRDADGFTITPAIRLIKTPGHTPQDLTTLVATDEGTVAFTHLWWFADRPIEDPLASDADALHRHRRQLIELATLIVPGHGAPFRVTAQTPR